MLRFLKLILLGLSLSYVVPLTVYVLLRGIPSDAPWWLDLANTFAPYLFIPAVPILLVGLLSLSRVTLSFCLLPTVLFLLLYGDLFLPGWQPTPNSTAVGATFTVMTHNLHAGSNSKHEGAIQAIVEADADIVALQELTFETAGTLTDRLGDKYPYRALVPQADHSGVGVLSRFPIETEESFRVGHLAQHLVLEVDGQHMHLFNFHPYAPVIRWMSKQPIPRYMVRGFDTKRQTQQVADIMEKVDNARGPMLVMGDFNITDQSRQYSRITQNLIDVYREVGWGFGHTFPADGYFPRLPRLLQLPLPLFRIDYVFHSHELVGLEASVGDSTGSDHLPIIARLSFKN